MSSIRQFPVPVPLPPLANTRKVNAAPAVEETFRLSNVATDHALLACTVAVESAAVNASALEKRVRVVGPVLVLRVPRRMRETLIGKVEAGVSSTSIYVEEAAST